ncbi:MAG: Rne/Rng family ribonuclease [Microthrixaceae bacterium]|nr:Rne/Rng family ribonuclease [Microthrixaceae bacterium]
MSDTDSGPHPEQPVPGSSPTPPTETSPQASTPPSGPKPESATKAERDPGGAVASPRPNQAGESGATPPKVNAPTGSEEAAEPDRSGSQGPDARPSTDGGTGEGAAKRRRRGSRGGRNRNRPRPEGVDETGSEVGSGSDESTGATPARDRRESTGPASPSSSSTSPGGSQPRRSGSAIGPGSVEGRSDVDKAAVARESRAPVESTAPNAAVPPRKPQIGDTRPAPVGPVGGADGPATADASGEGPKRKRRRGGRGRGGAGTGTGGVADIEMTDEAPVGAAGSETPARRNNGGPSGGSPRSKDATAGGAAGSSGPGEPGRRRGGRGGAAGPPVTAVTDDAPINLDEKTLRKRRGRERKGRPVGRYLMAVHVQPAATQIAVLEGRSLIEHYVSRPTDGINQIHGNIYLGKVQNVLPGMEAAFIDIGTPKNAVLYRGDTRLDPDDFEGKAEDVRIEQILRARQTILCQVTKNPIGAKGARLTQEVSIPGRFVVLVPNSTTYGISKRLPDNERKRLRTVLDKVRPEGHGLIVRTAAEGISAEELERDVQRLATQWSQIEALAARSQAPALLYQEPDMAVRVIREEFNQDYRQVVIDDDKLFEEVRDYVRSFSPALVDRVERYDPAAHGDLPIFETHHVHEQLHKALDRKVWLPSGGSLIIERTEALTVIDVNTGKNVGKSSLEETVFRNNLEAAEEVAHQLRLRDIGGIIVIDFIDMEIKANRETVIQTFRKALARDKTRTQVFDISELGLVEMTRKRIGEGLMESLSGPCPTCEGRGMVFDRELIGE